MGITIEEKKIMFEEITAQDGFKIIRDDAKKIFKKSSVDECWELGKEFYEDEDYRIKELGVFLFGYIADQVPEAVDFLHDRVANLEDWRVQEILAMAFDCYCSNKGYEESLPDIKAWLKDDNFYVRRACTEGLRIWTSRPYFKEHPEVAVALLANLKNDESEYVRKSVGNSLRDISKKYPDLVKEELETWDLSSKKVNQVYKLAAKIVMKIK